MKKQDLLNRRVRDLKIGPETTIKELMESFRDIGGFTAAKVRNGYDILKKMFSEENTTFLSFPADIISTGTRGIINDLVKKKLVDVIITTNGMLDHDIARTYTDYYSGSFDFSEHLFQNVITIANFCGGESTNILERFHKFPQGDILSSIKQDVSC